LSEREWLIFACGRYEGIDARVAEYYASDAAMASPPTDHSSEGKPTPSLEVLQCSIGDYVVAGGESAALVVIEATTRLLPGVVGNEASVAQESFADESNPASVEAPSYTRPEQWRGLSVPDVLRSGDHAAIERWRAEQAALTQQQRGAQ
jgi:tRNA (guanine37-N1)-methyltransferase